MNSFPKMYIVVLLFVGAAFANDAAAQNDPMAIEVLQKMAAYTGSLQKFVLTGETNADAALDDGLIISNSAVSTVSVDRTGSGSLHAASHDGVHTSEIFMSGGEVTIYSNKHNYYAKAAVPQELDLALQFALEEFEVETPLMDLLVIDAVAHFSVDAESILYIADKRPVRGVDCHHIVVRGPDADLQLWIEEGDRPVPRRTLMTLKNEPYMPRHGVFLEWQQTDEIDPTVFEFEPPDGAVEIELVHSP